MGNRAEIRRWIALGTAAAIALVALGGCELFTPREVFAITATPQFGFAPMEVEFAAITGGTEMVEWQWALGPDDFSTLPTVNRTYDAGSYTVTLAATDESGRSVEASINVYVRPSLTGTWIGAFRLDSDDDRPSGFEFDLEYADGAVTGTVTYGLYGDEDGGRVDVVEMPVVEGEATFDSIYIHAEGNSISSGGLHRLIFTGTPGSILSGSVTTYEGETFEWLAQRY